MQIKQNEKKSYGQAKHNKKMPGKCIKEIFNTKSITSTKYSTNFARF